MFFFFSGEFEKALFVECASTANFFFWRATRMCTTDLFFHKKKRETLGCSWKSPYPPFFPKPINPKKKKKSGKGKKKKTMVDIDSIQTILSFETPLQIWRHRMISSAWREVVPLALRLVTEAWCSCPVVKMF